MNIFSRLNKAIKGSSACFILKIKWIFSVYKNFPSFFTLKLEKTFKQNLLTLEEVLFDEVNTKML